MLDEGEQQVVASYGCFTGHFDGQSPRPEQNLRDFVSY